MSTACGETGRYAFLLTATPEPFTGATGSPVAPVGVLRTVTTGSPARRHPLELDGGAALLAPSTAARAATRLRRSRPGSPP